MNKDGRLPLIAPAEAAAKIREGALAADIRSRAEYRGGHIGGALSLPPEQHRGKLPDNAAPCLIFYCLGGKRTVCRHGQPPGCPSKSTAPRPISCGRCKPLPAG